MKSGQVLTDRRYKWFEPEYWRFGDPASAEGQINYMRHASGQVCTPCFTPSHGFALWNAPWHAGDHLHPCARSDVVQNLA